jgi:hypothetical protein
VNYYDSVIQSMGRSVVDDFVRLYMVPGVHHNVGRGPGLTTFQEPMLTALKEWVENGVAPHQIVATKYKIDGNPNSGILRTRPLCPHPQRAVYAGSGSIDDAKSFLCKAP